MAITGRFVADFEDFYKGTKKAEQGLVALETSGARMATTLDRQFTQMAGATRTTTTAFGSMVGGLDAVDRTLAAMGVNIGREVAALRELSAAATMTAGSMTLLSRAMGVVGVALLALQVAPLIFEKLTQLGGKLLDMMLGVQQTTTATAAGFDVMADAAKRLAAEQKALADTEKRIAEDRDAATKAFYERFRTQAAARAAVAKKEDEARLQAEADAAAKLAAIETAYRGFQNMVGERYLEDEARRMADEVRLTEEAAAAKIKAYEAWFKSVHDGLLIIGSQESGLLFGGPGSTTPGMAITGGSQSLERPQSLTGRGVYLPGDVPTYNPTFMPSMTGATPAVTVNMNGLLLSTDPAARNALRGTINSTFQDMFRSSGRSWGSG